MARQAVQSAELLPLFSDLHVREDNFVMTLGIVAQMCVEAIALGAREVGFLGDFYHVRSIMPLTIQNAVIDELDRWHAAGLTLIFIPGNHDQYDVQGRHAFEALRTHPAVRLYEQPTVDRWGLWIPYRHELEDVRRVLELHRGRVPAAFWHGPMLGAAMNDHRVADRGLAIDDFAGYPVAALGHFHLRQIFGPAAYVGSPWETRGDEAGQPKGFAVLRGARLEYVDRDWGPRRISVDADTPEAVFEALLRARAEDTVRVTVSDESQVEPVSRALAGRYADFVVTPRRAQVSSARAIPTKSLGFRGHAERLVEERAGDLDKTALMGAFEELTQA